MTELERLQKEVTRLTRLTQSLHSRIIALTTRNTELELVIERYASKENANDEDSMVG